MFPHIVTLYVVTVHPVTFATEQNITVLHGVLLDISKAVNVQKSGLTTADAATLYIPFGVRAVDGVTGEEKRFASPREYERAEDKSGLWTLDNGTIYDSALYFVKGEVVEPGRDFAYINLNYDEVHKITSVDTKDFGNLQHWQVGGQ